MRRTKGCWGKATPFSVSSRVSGVGSGCPKAPVRNVQLENEAFVHMRYSPDITHHVIVNVEIKTYIYTIYIYTHMYMYLHLQTYVCIYIYMRIHLSLSLLKTVLDLAQLQHMTKSSLSFANFSAGALMVGGGLAFHRRLRYLKQGPKKACLRPI